MKTNRVFAMVIVASLIVLIALTVQEAVATTAEVSDVNSGVRSFSNEEGLTVYRESERNSYPDAPAAFNMQGWSVYLESERHAAEASSQRLFNGKPFDAYQRSEWLGEDR